MTQRIAQNADGSVWMEYSQERSEYAAWHPAPWGARTIAKAYLPDLSDDWWIETKTHIIDGFTEPDAVCLLWQMANQE